MDPDVLREQLTTLHEELRQVTRLDPRSTLVLGEIMKDIKRLMESDGAEPAAGGTPGTLTERLEMMAVQFESGHPTLAASSRRLIDLLGKVGL